MPLVNLPDGQQANFPDSMSRDEIKAVLRKKFPPPAVAQSTAPPVSPNTDPLPVKDDTYYKDLLKKTGMPSLANVPQAEGMTPEIPQKIGDYVPGIVKSTEKVGEHILPQTSAEKGALLGGQYGETVGATVGPATAFGGGVLGAAAGGATGAGIDELQTYGYHLAHKMAGALLGEDPKKLEQEAIAAGEQPAPSSETLWQHIKHGAGYGALGQTLGSVMSKAMTKLMGPLAERLIPSLASPKDVLDVQKRLQNAATAEKHNIPLSAGQASESPTLNRLEGLAADATGSGAKFVEEQHKAAKEALENWIQTTATPKPLLTAGEEALAKLENNYGLARKKGQDAYKAAFQVTKGERFPLDAFRTAQKKLAAEQGGTASFTPGLEHRAAGVIGANTVAIPQQSPLLGWASSWASPKVLMALNFVKGHEADVETMHMVRSDLLKIVRDSQKQFGYGLDPEGRQAAILAEGLSKDIEEISDNPRFAQFQPLLDRADTIWNKEVASVFKNPPVIKAIRKKGDELQADAVIPFIFRKQGSIGPLRQFRRGVGDQGFDRAAASWFQKVMEDASPNGEFSLLRFTEEMKPKNYSPAFLEETFGKTKAKEFQDILSLFQQMKRSTIAGANPSQTARRGLIAGQLVALSGLIGHQLFTQGTIDEKTFGEGMAIFSPQIMSRLLFSPTGISLLRSSLMKERTPQELLKIATKMAAIAQFPTAAEVPASKAPTQEQLQAEPPKMPSFVPDSPSKNRRSSAETHSEQLAEKGYADVSRSLRNGALTQDDLKGLLENAA